MVSRASYSLGVAMFPLYTSQSLIGITIGGGGGGGGGTIIPVRGCKEKRGTHPKLRVRFLKASNLLNPKP